MAVRKVVNARQMQAAQLLIAGQSAYRALRTAGYSHWTARNFGALVRSSWGLREAIRWEIESRQIRLQAAPVRQRRYDRRSLCTAVFGYCGPEDRKSATNAGAHWTHRNEQRVRAIEEGKPLSLPVRCSVCGDLTEGKDHWCPRCFRVERA